jgi:hypothetical protein
LRDEPFDATTTGQNKGVPVSTLSWNSAIFAETGNMRFGARGSSQKFGFPANPAFLFPLQKE